MTPEHWLYDARVDGTQFYRDVAEEDTRREAGRAALALGRRLIEDRRKVGPERWPDFLRRVGLTPDAAQRYVDLAKQASLM